MADSSPDTWEDVADDIRRARAGTLPASVWQARAIQAEARVAELEETIDDALLLLAGGAPSLAARKLRAAVARPPGKPDHA